MGTTHCSTSDLESVYIEIKRQIHPILGELTLLQENTSSKYFHAKTAILSPTLVPRQFLQSDKNKKFLLQVQKIVPITINASPMFLCSTQQKCKLIFESVEVDLQSIKASNFFNGFKQAILLNIMSCVLEGIQQATLNKLEIFPINSRSVILPGLEQYNGQDLTDATFKVIPLDLIKLIEIETQNANTFDLNMPNSQLIHKKAHQSPKSHILSLGLLILDLLLQQLSRSHLEISFGNKIPNIFVNKSVHSMGLRYNMDQQIQNKLEFLNKEGLYSRQLKKILTCMLKRSEDNRIGHTCLFDRIKKLKIKQKSSQKKCSNFSQNELFSKNLHQRDLNKIMFNNHQLKKIYIYKSAKQIQEYIKKVQQKKISVFHAQSEKIQNKTKQRVKFENGAVYEKNIDENNRSDGFGTLYYTSGEICYIGYWTCHRFHGFGYLFNRKQLEQNNGEAICNDHNKFNDRIWVRYEGQFQNDLKHGYGILYFSDGSHFEGQFMFDKVQGLGNLVCNSGEITCGVWHDNRLVQQYS